MQRKACIHCDPYVVYVHSEEWVEKMLGPLNRVFGGIELFLKTELPRFYSVCSRILVKGLFRVASGSGIMREANILDSDEELHNRTLVVARAAHQRGLVVKTLKLFGRWATNFFSVVANGEKITFEGLPLIEVGYVLPIDIDDKFVLKQILRDNAFPYVRGGAFRGVQAALQYARELEFPLVVKPRSGSLSKHTTCGIEDECGLVEAIRVAQMVSSDFVVEKFIPGGVYRVTVIGSALFACLREAPNVVGDGVHTIEELVRMKNSDPRRGNGHQKNFTLHKINVGEKATSLLARQGFTARSIPPEGKRICLHDKVVLASGADILDKTDDVHQENKSMFLKLSRILGAPLVGVDFICEDIAKSWRSQPCAIIETNSLPYIDMHHFPVAGAPRDVAGVILDAALKRSESVLS